MLTWKLVFKSIKKSNPSVTEFVLHIKVISNSFLVIGDVVSEQDQVDSILDGLSKEYNSFVMQMYGMTKPPTLHDVEALLYVHEAQLAKFSQELALQE